MSRLSCKICILTLGIAIAIQSSQVQAVALHHGSVPYYAVGWNNAFTLTAPTGLEGEVSGPGWATWVGFLQTTGSVELTPTGSPVVFNWESNNVKVQGFFSSITFSATGTVDLIPLNPQFTEFTAEWQGDLVVTGGTGFLSFVGPADDPIHLTATNAPFGLTDPVRFFDWTASGRIRLFSF